MEKLELSQLKYLGMRKELISYLRGLSDREYQYQAWVNKNRPNGGYDELDYTIHFLYDDTELASDPFSMIGWILVNIEEAQAVSNVVKALDNVFDKYGLNLTDKEYIEKNEWENVIKTSIFAKEIMIRADSNSTK